MEQRLIDADALMERLKRKKCEPAKVRYTEGYNDALMRFRSMVHGSPTVDAVPVVRCKDCRWACLAPQRQTATCMKKRLPFTHDYDWFCADGERKNDE